MPDAVAVMSATVHRTGTMAVIALEGDLDGAAVDTLGDAVTEALAGAPPALGVDFSRVPYINSTGIALVVSLLTRARAAGTPVRVWGLSPHFAHIFAITRLTDHLTIHTDAGAAAGAPPPAGTAATTSDRSTL